MKRKDGMPDLVYWGLWGVATRGAARAYLWMTVGLSIACVVYSIWQPMFLSGILLLGGAYWYHYCIKWVDTHSSWTES